MKINLHTFPSILRVKRRTLLSLLVVILSSESNSQVTDNGQHLAKALSGVDWKRVASSIPEDPDFQLSVRNVFASLKPEAQRKVTDSIIDIKGGKGPLVTATPVDSLVRNKLAKALLPLVSDAEAKAQLSAFGDSGELDQLLNAITGGNRINATTSNPGSSTTSGLAGDKVKSEVQDLNSMKWIYAYAPPRSKPMTFLPNGEIGVGKNASEWKWEYRRPYLLVFLQTGEVGRAFVYDRGGKRWVGTSKTKSSLSSDGCYIARKPDDEK